MESVRSSWLEPPVATSVTKASMDTGVVFKTRLDISGSTYARFAER